ncbi:MAG: hypothetical protein RBG13Loki_0155 [Promethearchaeota archaeon CR_4]|nr:MAG: hypothetical protein RBG13Loki_0155 [Candidatus Lokiarchaeota archaeon CR_4]
MDLSGAKPITIADKPLFDRYFDQFPPEISELTFTNLFMWRVYYHWQFLEWEKHLLLFSRDHLPKYHKSIRGNRDTLMFLPPIGPNPAQVVCNIFKLDRPVEFHRVPKFLWDALQILPEARRQAIAWQDDRPNWDYEYLRSTLTTLSGGNLKPKRKWLNRFMTRYKYDFQLLSPNKPELLACIKKAQDTWCQQNRCEDSSDLRMENEAIAEALANYQALGFTGALILVEGSCIAYTFGEMLHPGTMVTHIEKAHEEYEGGYQAIMSLFLQADVWREIEFVNREQDLDSPGLRRAKESYDPHHMVQKGKLYR